MKIFLRILIVIIVIWFANRNKYFYVSDIDNLKGDEKFEVIDLINVTRPFYLGTRHSIKDISLFKDEENAIFVFISDGSRMYYNDTIMYKLNNDFSLSLTENKPKRSFSPLYFSKIPSPDLDLMARHRNRMTYLKNQKDIENIKVIGYNREFLIPYFFKSLFEICFSLNPFDCNHTNRGAEYTIKLKLKNGKLKLRAQGDDFDASIMVYYVNNPKKDDFVFIEEGSKIWILKSR